MLSKAFKQHKDLKGLVMHSDQGWHYQHTRYQQMLKSKGIVQSMSRKGNCLDNAMMENFFGLMKNELLYIKQFSSVEQFEVELKKYIRGVIRDRVRFLRQEKVRAVVTAAIEAELAALDVELAE